MIKYKEGDKVFIRHLTPKERHETSIFYATDMVKYEGTIGIVEIAFPDCYRLNVKHNGKYDEWTWHEAWLEDPSIYEAF